MTFVEPALARAPVDESGTCRASLRVEPFRAVPARLRAGHRVALGRDHRPAARHRARTASSTPGKARARCRPTGSCSRECSPSCSASRAGDAVTGRGARRRAAGAARRGGAAGRRVLGSTPTWTIGALHRLMREGGTLSGAFLAVDSARERRALPPAQEHAGRRRRGAAARRRSRASATTLAQSVTILTHRSRRSSPASSRSAWSTTRRGSRSSERGRELATLRVLGFTRAEIALILLGELAVLTLVALPLGMALGYGLAAAT